MRRFIQRNKDSNSKSSNVEATSAPQGHGSLWNGRRLLRSNPRKSEVFQARNQRIPNVAVAIPPSKHGLGVGIRRFSMPPRQVAIQDSSLIEDPLEVEQLQPLSQQTLCSQGSIVSSHFLGPPGHQNSSLSQLGCLQDSSFVSASSRSSRGSDRRSRNSHPLAKENFPNPPQDKASTRVHSSGSRRNQRGRSPVPNFLSSAQRNPSAIFLQHVSRSHPTVQTPCLSHRSNQAIHGSQESIASEASNAGRAHSDDASPLGAQGSGHDPTEEAIPKSKNSSYNLKRALLTELQDYINKKVDSLENVLQDRMSKHSKEQEAARQQHEENLDRRLDSTIAEKIPAEVNTHAHRAVETLMADEAAKAKESIGSCLTSADLVLKQTTESSKKDLMKFSKEATLEAKANLQNVGKALVSASKKTLEEEADRQVEKVNRSATTWMNELKLLTAASTSSIKEACQGFFRSVAEQLPNWNQSAERKDSELHDSSNTCLQTDLVHLSASLSATSNSTSFDTSTRSESEGNQDVSVALPAQERKKVSPQQTKRQPDCGIDLEAKEPRNLPTACTSVHLSVDDSPVISMTDDFVSQEETSLELSATELARQGVEASKEPVPERRTPPARKAKRSSFEAAPERRTPPTRNAKISSFVTPTEQRKAKRKRKTDSSSKERLTTHRKRKKQLPLSQSPANADKVATTPGSIDAPVVEIKVQGKDDDCLSPLSNASELSTKPKKRWQSKPRCSMLANRKQRPLKSATRNARKSSSKLDRKRPRTYSRRHASTEAVPSSLSFSPE